MRNKANKIGSFHNYTRQFLHKLPGAIFVAIMFYLVDHFDKIWLTPIIVFVFCILFLIFQPYLEALASSFSDFKILLFSNKKAPDAEKREANLFMLFIVPGFFAVLATLLHIIVRLITIIFFK